MKPYNRASSTKSEEVREMFDSIAPKYDGLNHILSLHIDRLWRRNVVSIVERFSPSTILDLATGTGDLAIAMARRITSANIIAIDPSEGMLRVAREKVLREQLEGRITIECAGAEELPLDDNSVDAVSVAFGVRNFGDIHQGLREMARVVKSGGHVVILEFSTPPNPIFRWFYRLYSRHILPLIGGLISRDRKAYEYLPASVEEFATPAQLIEMMQSVGLRECRNISQSFGIAQIYIGKKGDA